MGNGNAGTPQVQRFGILGVYRILHKNVGIAVPQEAAHAREGQQQDNQNDDQYFLHLSLPPFGAYKSP